MYLFAFRKNLLENESLSAESGGNDESVIVVIRVFFTS